VYRLIEKKRQPVTPIHFNNPFRWCQVSACFSVIILLVSLSQHLTVHFRDVSLARHIVTGTDAHKLTWNVFPKFPWMLLLLIVYWMGRKFFVGRASNVPTIFIFWVFFKVLGATKVLGLLEMSHQFFFIFKSLELHSNVISSLHWTACQEVNWYVTEEHLWTVATNRQRSYWL